MASGIVSRKEKELRQGYQDYLTKIGGINKNAMSYYQWLNQGKTMPPSQYGGTQPNVSSRTPGLSEAGTESRTVTTSVGDHRKAEQASLENALDAEEIKRYNRD
jgi:hypothetical protein